MQNCLLVSGKEDKLKKNNDSIIIEFNSNGKIPSVDTDTPEEKTSKVQRSTSCESLNQDSKFEYLKPS